MSLLITVFVGLNNNYLKFIDYIWHTFSFLTDQLPHQLNRLMEEPAAYGKLGLAKLLEMREECLREFHFVDAYISIKQR